MKINVIEPTNEKYVSFGKRNYVDQVISYGLPKIVEVPGQFHIFILSVSEIKRDSHIWESWESI